VVCTKAYALKIPDPDGGRRCFMHSTDPVNAAKRGGLAAVGAAQGAKQKGIPPAMRKPVAAGVVDINEVRAQFSEKKAKAARETEAIPLDSKENVLKFLARSAGELMDERPTGWATAAAALARTALAAMGLEEQERDEDEPARGFSYETTTGEKVAVRGRGDDGVH